MTLALRPFNFETLATVTHQYAVDERFAEATPGALAIVLAGVVPVILLSRTHPRRITPARLKHITPASLP